MGQASVVVSTQASRNRARPTLSLAISSVESHSIAEKSSDWVKRTIMGNPDSGIGHRPSKSVTKNTQSTRSWLSQKSVDRWVTTSIGDERRITAWPNRAMIVRMYRKDIDNTGPGRRRSVTALDTNAQTLGVSIGVAVAKAQALVPGLIIHDADPVADGEAISQASRLCLFFRTDNAGLGPRWSPSADR